MSKLEELLEGYCPDGVEYKPLKEIATIVRGSGLQKKDFTDEGIGCIHYGQIYTRFGAFTDQVISHVSPEYAKKLKKVEPGDLVVAVTSENVEDVCKCVAWLGKDSIVTGGHAVVVKHKQNPKFLSYYFQSEEFFKQKAKAAQGTKVIDVSPQKLGEIVFPVPPLPVQEEIVRILDMFTGLTAELTAELTARKKQYEYYRDQILTFDSDIPHKKLGKSCILKAGKHISAEFISDAQDENHPYECFGGNGLRGYVSSYIYDGCYPLVGRQGALCGNVQYSHGKFYPTEHAVVVSPRDNSYDSRFLYHLLIKMDLNQYKSAGAQPGLAVKNLNEIEAPVPSMDIQRKIAEVLDHFDSLCSDISTGLPAEIEAREKQYEYYRDKLLTFKRKA